MTGATMQHENVQPRSSAWLWVADVVLAPTISQQLAGYGVSVAHRLAQCQQYKGASYG